MTRLREIGRYGNAWIIKLSPVDVRDFNIKEGDKVDLEDMIIKTKRGKKDGARN